MDDSDSNKRDDKVGKGKPPRATRWKKGQSGNPGGRPKGAMSWKTAVEKELSKHVTVVEGDKERRLSKKELVVRSAVNMAITNNDYRGLKALGAFDEKPQDEICYEFTLKLEEDDQGSRDGSFD